MNTPKRHHFVPRMLLRGFAPADEPGKVWQIKTSDKSDPVLVSIGNVALIKHFYTMYRDRPSKDADFFWEELLSEWEGRAAGSLRALDETPDKMQAPVSLLVVLQMLRTPLGQAQLGRQAHDERVTVFGDADSRVLARWWMRRKGRIPELHEWQALQDAAAALRVGEQHPLLTVDATVILDEMLTVVRHSGLGERLWDGGKWNVLRDESRSFMIGDEPVTYRGQHNPARPLWAQEQLPQELTMPISADRCLEVRPDLKAPGLDYEDIDRINSRAFEWASMFVFGPDPDTLVSARAQWQLRGCSAPPPLSPTSRRRR